MRRFGVLLGVIVVVVGFVTWQIWPAWGAATPPTRQSDVKQQSTDVKPLPTIGVPEQIISEATPVAALVGPALPRPTATPALPRPVKMTDAEVPTVNAQQIVVIDAETGEVLYGYNEHEHTPMASITKIATAIVALERGKLQDQVLVEYDPTELVDSTAMGCNPGETYSLEDLLYGLMLPSGNDAALAIANHIAGSEQAFVHLMNDKVQQLGLKDTHFANPHGLDNPDHYSSAYDMAMLGRYGMQNATFRELAKARVWDVHGSKDFQVFNLNRFLWNYDGADGIKIGYTEAAGRTIVASATRGGHRVIVAWMHGSDIVKDVTPLLDYVFDNYEWKVAVPGPTGN
jgi:serine-type D-Ala-D-Ala carboxypeptidase (penicillin-binding protein 5/6)